MLRSPRDVSDYDPVACGAKCAQCPRNGSRFVPAQYGRDEGPPEMSGSSGVGFKRKPRFVLLGEGPGYNEEILRAPFQGKSGNLVDERLDEVGLSRDEAWISNSFLCRGDERDDERAAECCAPRLLNELASIPAHVPIVALGKSAARSVLGVKSILLARGFVWSARALDGPLKSVEASIRKASRERRPRQTLLDLQLRREILQGRHALAGRTVFPTVHPAFVLRSDVWTPIMRVDFERIAGWLAGKLSKKDFADEGQYKVVHRVDDVKKTLARLKDTVACDIETDGKNPITARVLCVGLSDGKFTMVIEPWAPRKHGRHLTEALWHRVTSFHNGFNFDHISLERDGVSLPLRVPATGEFPPLVVEKLGIPEGDVEDTLLGHHAFASHMPQRLDHVVSVFLPAASPWKIKHGMRGGAEEKGLLPVDMSPEDRARYNGSDARCQARTWLSLQDDLRDEKLVYEHDKQLAALCKEMYVTGIRRDEGHAQHLVKMMCDKTDKLTGELRGLARKKSFGPSKNADVRTALRRLGVGTLFLTPTGLVSTASGTLEAIADSNVEWDDKTRADKFATNMLKWRAIDKARSTYIEAPEIQALADGRFHPNWKPFGTVTGRLSCRLQSAPRRVLTDEAKALLKANPKWKAPDVEKAIGIDATWEVESRIREIYVPAPGKVFFYFDLCFATGTLVDGPVGAKPIETLAIGDLVYTYRASTRKPAIGKVTERIRVGRAPVVKVTLDNGETVRCTPDHKWLVCPRFQKDTPVERRADELRYGDRLLPLRKVVNRGSWRHPAEPREYLYAHSAAQSSQTHVEVALTEYGPRPPGWHTHHKDGNAMNNAPSNLEYKSAAAHRSAHARESATAQWADPLTRTAIIEGCRANGEKWRKEGRFAGRNNPRFGDRRQRRTKTCEECRKEFEFFASNGGAKTQRRFCSKKCDVAAKAVKKACLRCDRPVKQTRNKFCSHSCARLAHLHGLNHRVVDVVPDGHADVWSIAVSPDHNYALAAGVFVKNCQSEMRAAAYLSGDEVFIANCAKDIHTANAKILFPRARDILDRDPKGEGKEYRDVSKNAGFGILYDAMAATIFSFLRAKGFPVELEQVEEMFAFIRETYARYYEFCNEKVAECQQNGFLRTAIMNRIRWLGFFPEVTVVYNYSVQSLIADLMNLCLINTRTLLPKSARPVFQGHDSLCIEVDTQDSQTVQDLMTDYWAKPIFIPTSGKMMTMPIDLHVGERLSDF